MIDKIPKLKKEIKNFILDEHGSVTKEKVLKTGIVIGTLLTMSNIASSHHVNHTSHANTMSLDTTDPYRPIGQHSHHSQQTVNDC